MTDYDLTGRSALVTGASQGLGLKIAQKFAAAGCDLFLCSRNSDRLNQAALEIVKVRRHPNQKVLFKTTDVSDPYDVEELASDVLKAFEHLTIFVSNAGIYGPMGRLEDINLKAFRSSLEINLMGPVLLARALLPHFRRQGYGKIIQISGGGATNPMPRIESYAASKAAVVRLMESIALDLIEDRVDVNSVAPGLLDTRLLGEVLKAGPHAVGQDFYDRMRASRDQGRCTDLDIGAQLCLFLASSASDGITGRLISAVWDDYKSWPDHLEELKKSDAYTIRRVTGRDRGTNWGDK
ncbi:MAG: SDR family oxidoreductase [Deltaproteobacteria bacterium]|nr:SDR family oxidoreductase [Deltaproteobacteria bacterium]